MEKQPKHPFIAVIEEATQISIDERHLRLSFHELSAAAHQFDKENTNKVARLTIDEFYRLNAYQTADEYKRTLYGLVDANIDMGRICRNDRESTASGWIQGIDPTCHGARYSEDVRDTKHPRFAEPSIDELYLSKEAMEAIFARIAGGCNTPYKEDILTELRYEIERVTVAEEITDDESELYSRIKFTKEEARALLTDLKSSNKAYSRNIREPLEAKLTYLLSDYSCSVLII